MHGTRTLLGLAVLFSGTLLAGCTSTMTRNPNVPVGEAAYRTIPATIPAPTVYAIAPKDVLQVRVFGEPDLSVEKARVDEAGFIQIPLAGQIKAAGRSAPEVKDEITGILARKYLKDPQVVVAVDEAAPRFVTVEGEVKVPGSFELSSNTTLLGALAKAQSPSPTAKLDQVVIFRTIDGQRMVARFDVKDIRGGVSPDPIVMDGDLVVVGNSKIKTLWQDFLKTAPLFNAFAVMAR